MKWRTLVMEVLSQKEKIKQDIRRFYPFRSEKR